MKYLLVTLVVVIAIGIWRNNRRAAREAAVRQRAPAAPLSPPQSMVTCAHCGLHLPQSDAYAAPQQQYYCSAEHLRLGQRAR